MRLLQHCPDSVSANPTLCRFSFRLDARFKIIKQTDCFLPPFVTSINGLSTERVLAMTESDYKFAFGLILRRRRSVAGMMLRDSSFLFPCPIGRIELFYRFRR